jgi:glycine cleavage system transcriptional repressor
LEGADNPGIVHKLTSFMNRHGLSVDKMETSDEIAPHGGTTLFHMKGTANALEPLAAGFDIDEIKRDMEVLADELNCDIHMEDQFPSIAGR